jgi:hypothetical protein
MKRIVRLRGKRAVSRMKRIASSPTTAVMLAGWMSFISFCLGLSMVLNPGVFLKTETFVTAMSWASPFAWGVSFIVTAVFLLVEALTERQRAQLPLLILSGIYAAFGLATVGDVISGGLPSVLWVYSGLSGICIITMIACRREGAQSHAKKSTEGVK